MPSSARACDPIRKLYTFTVEGRGPFPIDMLRYDSCWPQSEGSDSYEIDISHQPRRAGQREHRVTLCGITEPTAARWESFGYAVV